MILLNTNYKGNIMEHIYFIKLKEGKYYIGKTKNIERRYDEHITGNGSVWTKRYKPISLIKTIKSTSYFDEDRYVKEYMAKYGIDNVRGGTYSNVVLDKNSLAVLEKEIRHSKNECMRCGRDTHFINDCYATTYSNGENIDKKFKDDAKNSSSSSSSIRPIIKTANNKGIITPKTTIKVLNNNGNKIIEFSNIRDYGKWAETDIAQNGSWKVEVF
jgi:predicted GIY-YIG superfamily endonuclease